MYERVQDDVVQIGWAIHQVVAGKFPLSEVAGLPFVEGGFSRASLALYRLAKTGLLNNEYKDVVPLVFSVFGPSQMHFARQPRSIDDLNGLKIGVAGRAPSQLVAALGGTPISMQPGEFYEALQRRTVDAVITSWSAFAPYKLQEVTTYHVETLLGQGTSMFFMAKKKYDALPEAARKVLAANADEATTLAFSKHFDNQWLELQEARRRVRQAHDRAALSRADRKMAQQLRAGVAGMDPQPRERRRDDGEISRALQTGGELTAPGDLEPSPRSVILLERALFAKPVPVYAGHAL